MPNPSDQITVVLSKDLERLFEQTIEGQRGSGGRWPAPSHLAAQIVFALEDAAQPHNFGEEQEIAETLRHMADGEDEGGHFTSSEARAETLRRAATLLTDPTCNYLQDLQVGGLTRDDGERLRGIAVQMDEAESACAWEPHDGWAEIGAFLHSLADRALTESPDQ